MLPRKLSIGRGNLQPTRLHFQKQVIIIGFLQLSHQHCPSAFFSFLVKSKVRDTGATAFRMKEEGLVMDHGCPHSVFKLCRQEAREQKQVGKAVISATTCGLRPGPYRWGLPSREPEGGWERAGGWTPGPKTEKQQNENPLVGPGDRWQGRAVWPSLGGRGFRVIYEEQKRLIRKKKSINISELAAAFSCP